VERGDKIVMRGGGAMSGPSACWITKIERYTPDMEKAYQAALEAKKPARQLKGGEIGPRKRRPAGVRRRWRRAC